MMLLLTALLLLAGVFLSGFFSGSETGFYRANRVRVVIAALQGDRFSTALIRLINNPALFVATTLVGNNVANYITSIAIVLLARQVDASSAGEMLAPILLSPLLFIYGELLPKNIFYLAPNLLLRIAAPLFLVFTILFSPLAAILWGFSRLLEVLVGQSPDKIRLTLARREVEQVFAEASEAGILHPSQRHLAQSFFFVAARSVGSICQPINRVVSVDKNTTSAEIRKLAQQKRLADIPVFESTKPNVVGYVRTVDLLIDPSLANANAALRGLRTVQHDELAGEVILQMQANRETLLLVVGKTNRPIGILSIDQLTDPLLNGPLDSLKR